MNDAKLDLFIEMTNDRFDKVEVKLDQLISFRMMLLGGSVVVSAIVSTVIFIVFGR